MSLFDRFEKLINEHGSSFILKEHLALVRAEYEALDRKYQNLNAENEAQKFKLDQDNSRINSLQREIDALKSGSLATYVCDHCGSPNIKRTGSRPDPTFGGLGIKQKLFICNQCGRESAFTPES